MKKIFILTALLLLFCFHLLNADVINVCAKVTALNCTPYPFKSGQTLKKFKVKIAAPNGCEKFKYIAEVSINGYSIGSGSIDASVGTYSIPISGSYVVLANAPEKITFSVKLTALTGGGDSGFKTFSFTYRKIANGYYQKFFGVPSK